MLSSVLLGFLGGLGSGEVIVLLIVVLLFFGAKRIPDLARGLGKGIKEFKDAKNGVEEEKKD
jgi:sec-independent protein translocase protein TatA